MSFFEDTDGISYPLSRVRRIMDAPDRLSDNPKMLARVELDDETYVEVYPNAVEQIKIAAGPLIAALPGTFLLHYTTDDEGEYIGRDPIVGWSIGGGGYASPIVVDVEFEGVRGNMAYQMPDKRLYSWTGQSWDTEEEWIQHHRKLRELTGLDR